MNYSLKYNLSFQAKVNGFKVKDIKKKTEGLSDALGAVSIIREGIGAHNGGLSCLFMSIDGHNEGKAIPITEWFSIFMSLASMLNDNLEDGWQKDIAFNTIELFRIAKGIKI